MKLRDLMSKQVIRIHPEEPVAVAARTLVQYNIGALPVCGRDGRIYGMITDRDLVVRCMAGGRMDPLVKVGDVMTARVVAAGPDLECALAARIMGRERVRRLPVVENGKMCGFVSLADLASREETATDAADALAEITEKIRVEKSWKF